MARGVNSGLKLIHFPAEERIRVFPGENSISLFDPELYVSEKPIVLAHMDANPNLSYLFGPDLVQCFVDNKLQLNQIKTDIGEGAVSSNSPFMRPDLTQSESDILRTLSAVVASRGARRILFTTQPESTIHFFALLNYISIRDNKKPVYVFRQSSSRRNGTRIFLYPENNGYRLLSAAELRRLKNHFSPSEEIVTSSFYYGPRREVFSAFRPFFLTPFEMDTANINFRVSRAVTPGATQVSYYICCPA